MEEQQKAKVGLIAVVEKFAGPEEKRPIEVISAPTKREMIEKLADPGIASILSVIRGRQLTFTQSRKVAF